MFFYCWSCWVISPQSQGSWEDHFSPQAPFEPAPSGLPSKRAKAACPTGVPLPPRPKQAHRAVYLPLSGEQGKIQPPVSPFGRNIPKCPDHWTLETRRDGKALTFLGAYLPSAAYTCLAGDHGVRCFLTRSH